MSPQKRDELIATLHEISTGIKLSLTAPQAAKRAMVPDVLQIIDIIELILRDITEETRQ
jgi:hypothetical protein